MPPTSKRRRAAGPSGPAELAPQEIEIVAEDVMELDGLVRMLAPQIETPAEFEAMLDQVRGGVEMREAVRQAILPYLSFELPVIES